MTFLAQRKTLSLQLNPIHALNMWSWERSSGVASFFFVLIRGCFKLRKPNLPLFFCVFVCVCVEFSFKKKQLVGFSPRSSGVVYGQQPAA